MINDDDDHGGTESASSPTLYSSSPSPFGSTDFITALHTLSDTPSMPIFSRAALNSFLSIFPDLSLSIS